MKKILILLAIMVPISVIAEEALSGVNEPEWKDFAPHAYINIEQPKGIGKLNETASYWYKRKADFESSIKECREMTDYDAQLSCYQEVKIKQYQKNSDYNARLEAQERARMVPQEMYDRTNTMLPIGNYLNNFARFQPNELRGY